MELTEEHAVLWVAQKGRDNKTDVFWFTVLSIFSRTSWKAASWPSLLHRCLVPAEGKANPPALRALHLLYKDAWAKILLPRKPTEVYLWKGQDLDPKEPWKEKNQEVCLGGSPGDSWTAKGAWESTEHIYKLKLSLESLSVPHQELLQKCREQLLRICWKQVNKSITHWASAPCHVQWHSSQGRPYYLAIMLWTYWQW